VGMRRGTDRHTDTQTAVTIIHFASATPHAKCNKNLTTLLIQIFTVSITAQHSAYSKLFYTKIEGLTFDIAYQVTKKKFTERLNKANDGVYKVLNTK